MMSSDDGDRHLLLPDIYMHNSGYDEKQTWHVIKTRKSSSSSSSSSSRKKKLLIKEGDGLLEPELPQLPTDIISFSSAAMGSTIYVFGGHLNIPVDSYRRTPRLNKVYYIDTDVQNPEWKEGPSMILGRHDHYSFAHEGKLHVLSGHSFFSPVDEDGTQLFAEVYDPASGEGWKELARAETEDFVAHKTVVGHAVVDHDSRKKILFHAFMSDDLYGILLGYNPIWIYDSGFDRIIHTSAFVDGILYYLNDCDMQHIYAFDVNEPGSEHKHVVFDQKRRNCLPYRRSWDEPAVPSSFFLSLGNRNLAVIWAHEHYSGSDLFIRVHCSILEMSKVDHCFKARILDYSNYVMRPGTLERCVAVWPSREDGKAGQNTEIPNKKCKSGDKRNRNKKKRCVETRKRGKMDKVTSITAG